jgi:hypothetical protein
MESKIVGYGFAPSLPTSKDLQPKPVAKTPVVEVVVAKTAPVEIIHSPVHLIQHEPEENGFLRFLAAVVLILLAIYLGQKILKEAA